MRTLTCLLLGLALVSALPCSVKGQITDSALVQPDTVRVPDPRAALLLGLIPGGGQVYNGKWLKALLVITVEGYLIYKFQQNRDLYNNYDEYDPPLSHSRETYLEARNKYAWQALFVYILGLVDGFVDAHLSTFPEDTLYQAQPLPSSYRPIEEGL